MITLPYHPNEMNNALSLPVTSLKGIGEKRARALAGKGIHTLVDLLYFTPIRYEDRREIVSIDGASEGKPVLIKGVVVSGKEEKFYRSGKRLFRIVIRDQSGNLDLLWFQYRRAHLNHLNTHGLEVLVYGKIQKNYGRKQMIHPEVTVLDGGKRDIPLGLYPVYPNIPGISMQVLRPIIKDVLEQYGDAIPDGVPRHVTRRLGLPTLSEAVRGVHAPPNEMSVDQLNRLKSKYHQRLLFDKFFWFMMQIVSRKRRRKTRPGPVFTVPDNLINRVRKNFPFSFTDDQLRVLNEIITDMKSGSPMNRLLLGDVGCGKTVVAVSASYMTILNKRQVAIMAPTQVLARQHESYFSGLVSKMGFRIAYLTGALKKRERERIYKKIRNGECNLILGTHALVQEDVQFHRLGLVVIDEQHRFGVRQRSMLECKGEDPHLLVMTATPIPRSLAMTVYADLDISVIKTYPRGHQPVSTELVREDQKRRVFDMVNEKMTDGQQAIVICPVIEGFEETDLKDAIQMHARLERIFAPRFRVGLIHGRMSSDEKDFIMDEFRNRQIHLLVGTTVIEVGVHAPGATVMVIEHPERFGLAQLHQLRGRVGRGAKRGHCFLMLPDRLPQETFNRLKILAETNNGFEIARKDLEIRGQGELLGVRQAGAGEIDFRELFREPDLLNNAKREAEGILESDPQLSRPENHILKAFLETSCSGPLAP
jgi:ATP-dependent DNA helicase RecG